jgi:hypothetical protein
LEVSGPAASVYDAYATQARAAGFALEWSDTACQNVSGTDVTCSGAGRHDRGTLHLDLRVCTTCAPPVSSMTLMQIGAGSRGDLDVGRAPTDRDPTFELQLDVAPRDAARRARPDVGQLVVPSPFSVIRLVRGSRTISTGDQCVAAAVVRVPEHADAIFRRYVDQLPHETPVRVTAGRFQGRRARDASGDWGAVRMVERDGSAVIAISECEDQ